MPTMDPKPRPNDAMYLEILRRMTPAQRLAKAFELTEFARAMHLHGLRRRFPHLDEEGLRREAARRLAACRNRSY